MRSNSYNAWSCPHREEGIAFINPRIRSGLELTENQGTCCGRIDDITIGMGQPGVGHRSDPDAPMTLGGDRGSMDVGNGSDSITQNRGQPYKADQESDRCQPASDRSQNGSPARRSCKSRETHSGLSH